MCGGGGAMAEATWAGMYVLAIKPHGTTISEKQEEHDDIASNMVRGGPNLLMEDPNNIGYHTVDFSPKVTEFKDLMEALARYSVATIGLPHSMFYDESQSNRSTMLGKIQLARETVMNPMREWIGRSFSDQWYMRWFRLIYKDKGDLLKKFRIKMVFNDLQVEQWFDRVEAVNELDSRRQLTDDAYGEMLGLQNYISKVVPTAQTTPGGSGGKKFRFADDKGNKFEIKKQNKEF